jgi:tRNA(adenine34) deaminase
LSEAKKAIKEGEFPVGAVVVRDGLLLGRGHNMVERLRDATAHAEVIAIGAASRTIGDWRLVGATLYTTLEPCLMCAGAIDVSRLGRVVYAAGDSRKGAFGSVLDVTQVPGLCPNLKVDYGLRIDEAAVLLEGFFRSRRVIPTDGSKP